MGQICSFSDEVGWVLLGGGGGGVAFQMKWGRCCWRFFWGVCCFSDGGVGVGVLLFR